MLKTIQFTISIAICLCSCLGAQASELPYERILVVTAVDYEYAAVASILVDRVDSTIADRQASNGRHGRLGVLVIRGGWGKSNSAGATAIAIEGFRPQLVVMAGIGGSLGSDQLASGDIAIADGTFHHDLGRYKDGAIELWPPETPRETNYGDDMFHSPRGVAAIAINTIKQGAYSQWKLPAACTCEKDGTKKPTCTGPELPVGRSFPKVCSGIIATGDSFVVDPRLAAKLRKERNAVAVDMETAAVAQEAANHKIPFMGIRVMADTVDNELGESLYYCLKPMSGPRLRESVRRLFVALEESRPDGAMPGNSSDGCIADSSPKLPTRSLVVR